MKYRVKTALLASHDKGQEIGEQVYNNYLTAGCPESWFEEVQEFEVGDWVFVTESLYKLYPNSSVFKIHGIDPHGNLWTEDGYCHATERVRKATKYEIEEALSEVIEGEPIVINGYKAEFKDDYVKFGCAKIDKRYFIQMYNKYYEAWHNEGTGNRCVTAIKIGEGLFTIDQIKQIAEYYEQKD